MRFVARPMTRRTGARELCELPHRLGAAGVVIGPRQAGVLCASAVTRGHR